MSLKRLWTALKGGVNEGLEVAADGQAIRILEQEMREAKAELIKCDQSLTTIMGKRKLAEQKCASLSSDVETYTAHAIKASEAGDEALAIECAERVAELESSLSTEQDILSNFKASENTLKANIAQAKANVRRMEQQIDQVKATESVQKAQVAVSSRHLGANSKVKTAVSSLERIKQKQAEKAAELDAARELAAEESGDSLDAKLKSAGIAGASNTSGSDKLAALLAKKKG